MMMEKLLIEEQIIKRWHQKTITRPSPIEIHPNVLITPFSRELLNTVTHNGVVFVHIRWYERFRCMKL